MVTTPREGPGGAGMHLTDGSVALKQVFPSLTELCRLSQEPVHLRQLSQRPLLVPLPRSSLQGPQG